jgi:7,8-dihydropterin-6-yl-methyl-4-(beta-D-ribofuranosyl)aminobenzene 5'-phosphate synthase
MRLQHVGCSVAVALGLTCGAGAAAAEPARAVKVTVLSTMLAGNRGGGIGEWGFAALLEVDGQRLLIDTGERPETVMRNASELGIDLSGVSDLVLTHNHSDADCRLPIAACPSSIADWGFIAYLIIGK